MFVATAYPGTEMFKHPKVQSVLNSNFKINFDFALLKMRLRVERQCDGGTSRIAIRIAQNAN